MGLVANLVGKLRSRADSAPQIGPPKGRLGPQVLPKVDSDEALATGADRVIAECVGSTFEIAYVDSKNEFSRRTVTVRDVCLSGGDNVLIRAYCHARESGRTFRADRIQEVVDLSTGEVLSDPFAYFASVAMPGFATERTDTDLALERCRYGIQLLVFLARCDGEYHPSEHETILRYIADQSTDLDPDRNIINKNIATQHPDLDNFYRALDYFAEQADEAELRRVVRYLVELVDADGILSPEEAEFVIEIQQTLNEAGYELN